MLSRTVVVLGLCVFVTACSTRTVGEENEGASDAAETTEDAGTVGDTGTDETAETTGGDDESCACIELHEFVCDDENRPMALHDCDVPNPCGRVNLDSPDADVATCVLELLIEQDQPSRFDYIAHVPGDWGDDTYRGTFFVLNPNTGADIECLYPSYDCCGPPPPVVTPAFHELEDPAYFEDCLGKTASVMTGCIFNGVHALAAVPECSGP